MLLTLVIGSGALAVTGLAAWWVVVPPTVMLLGYTALLREAAKADATVRTGSHARGQHDPGGGARHGGGAPHGGASRSPGSDTRR